MRIITLDIDPAAKPRMTQSDKWNVRPTVARYRAFKDRLRFEAKGMGLDEIPGSIPGLVFNIPLPRSWSSKKRNAMRGKPHQQRPDLDNLLKGFMDSLCEEDSYIHAIGELKKLWGDSGSIIITLNEATEIERN